MIRIASKPFTCRFQGVFFQTVYQRQPQDNVLSPLNQNDQWLLSTLQRSHYNTDQYVQYSFLPTNHFLKSLPRLPIPDLDKTCDRYLAAQRVLLNDSQYKRTEEHVIAFRAEGKALQAELKAIDSQNKHMSYISVDWSNKYLKDRSPVVLNHNPFLAFNDAPTPEYNKLLTRATNLIISSLRFMNTYNARVLEPEMYHLYPEKSDNLSFRRFVRMLPSAISWYGAYMFNVYPLDMANFPWLFNSTRIPRQKKDMLYNDNHEAKQLLVMRNGHFYVFDVIDKGKILPGDVMLAHLAYIKQLPNEPNSCPLGYLTAEDRDVWADVREMLIAAGNEDALEQIDTSIFAVSLDDEEPANINDLTRQFLHGSGSNRWYDKSFSLIFTHEGRCCVNFEHSWGDGLAVLRYFNETFKNSNEVPAVHPDTQPATVDSAAAVRKLEFQLTNPIRAAVGIAKTSFDNRMSQLQLDHCEYANKQFNKTYMKEKKVSPDSIMQLIIQLAFYREYGHFASTYESCSTAAFRRGRTETIRSATMATKTACEMILHPRSTTQVSELRELIKLCSKKHVKLTREAAMGQGYDRHLWALKNLAEKKGQVPNIFLDPAYQTITHDTISTSTLDAPSVSIGGFGPPAKDGFGVGYGISENRLGFNVTSYQERDVHAFIRALDASTDDIFNILEGRIPNRDS